MRVFCVLRVKFQINRPIYSMSSKVGAWFKEKAREAKYKVTRKTDAEKAFLECTNDDKWGPSNTQMAEVVRYSRNYKDWQDIKKLFSELFEKGSKEVLCIKKGLTLLEYLINNGGDNMRSEARQFQYSLQYMTSMHQHTTGELAAFEAVIRKKAQDILNLMNDNDLYQMEREKARKLKSSLSAVTRDEYGGSYTTQTYNDDYYGGGGGYSSSTRGGFDDRYGSSTRGGFDDGGYAPRRTQPKPAPPADDDYYSDDEPPSKPAAPPQQGQFNPFQDRQPAPQPQQPQQQFNPFTQQQPAQQQQFNPFGQQQRPQQPQQFNPFAQQPAAQPPAQQQFNPFAGQQPQNPSSNAGDLMSLMSTPAQPISPDDMLGFSSPAPAPVAAPQPVQQQPPMDSFIDLSTPVPAPAAAPSMQPAAAAKRQGGMLDEFGDLVNLNLKGNEERAYGRAGMQQRGTGQTLGGGWQ